MTGVLLCGLSNTLFVSNHFSIAIIANPASCLQERPSGYPPTQVLFLDSIPERRGLVLPQTWALLLCECSIATAAGITDPVDWEVVKAVAGRIKVHHPEVRIISRITCFASTLSFLSCRCQHNLTL